MPGVATVSGDSSELVPAPKVRHLNITALWGDRIAALDLMTFWDLAAPLTIGTPPLLQSKQAATLGAGVNCLPCLNLYLAAQWDLRLSTQGAVLDWKHLNLTESKIFLLLAIISDVNKLAPVAITIIAEENSDSLFKLSAPGGARLVQGFVALHQLNDKDGEVLKAARRNGHSDALHNGCFNLDLPPTLVEGSRSERASLLISVHCHGGGVVEQSL